MNPTSSTIQISPSPPSKAPAAKARAGIALRIQNLLLASALVVALTGWKPWPAEKKWVSSEIYFGMSKPDGSIIPPGEWQDFINKEITPRFPAGLSIVDTAGQWRDAGGEIDREPGKLLVLLHPDDDKLESEIDVIRKLYCARFQQEAVMKVTVPVSVTF